MPMEEKVWFMEVSLAQVWSQMVDLEAARAAFPRKEASPCLLYTSPSPRDRTRSRMPSSA